jgi:hypothetical protein
VNPPGLGWLFVPNGYISYEQAVPFALASNNAMFLTETTWKQGWFCAAVQIG